MLLEDASVREISSKSFRTSQEMVSKCLSIVLVLVVPVLVMAIVLGPAIILTTGNTIASARTVTLRTPWLLARVWPKLEVSDQRAASVPIL
jgi:hypothetical protein